MNSLSPVKRIHTTQGKQVMIEECIVCHCIIAALGPLMELDVGGSRSGAACDTPAGLVLLEAIVAERTLASCTPTDCWGKVLFYRL